MMSSVCTLRLKRRRAFSKDSPSCNRTSAKLKHPQTYPVGQSQLLQSWSHKSSRISNARIKSETAIHPLRCPFWAGNGPERPFPHNIDFLRHFLPLLRQVYTNVRDSHA